MADKYIKFPYSGGLEGPTEIQLNATDLVAVCFKNNSSSPVNFLFKGGNAFHVGVDDTSETDTDEKRIAFQNVFMNAAIELASTHYTDTERVIDFGSLYTGTLSNFSTGADN